MIGLVLAILILLWFFGYIHVSFIAIPDIVLFAINGHPVTLWDLLILFVVGWAIKILPSPFREIITVLLVFWILSILGILGVIAGLSNILVIIIIIAIVISFIL